MGKLLEDIRMEFASQFNQGALIGVPASSLSSTVPATDPPPTAISTPAALFPMTLPVPGGLNDAPGNLRPSMFDRLSTPPETVTNPQPNVSEEDMDHTDPPDSHTRETTEVPSS